IRGRQPAGVSAGAQVDAGVVESAPKDSLGAGFVPQPLLSLRIPTCTVGVPGADGWVPGETVLPDRASADGASAEDAPGDSLPADDAPSESVPADGAPGDCAPGDCAPADDAPGDCAPADDAP